MLCLGVMTSTFSLTGSVLLALSSLAYNFKLVLNKLFVLAKNAVPINIEDAIINIDFLSLLILITLKMFDLVEVLNRIEEANRLNLLKDISCKLY